MVKRLGIGILLALCWVTLSFSQVGLVTILNHREDVFLNTDCKKSRTCDLLRVEYITENYSVDLGDDYNYGTRFFARIETKRVRDLEKFVFVQFIKGCDFSSQLVNGQVELTYEFVYSRDGVIIPFKFPDWTVDSDSNNPVYTNVPGRSRFFAYRWNTIPDSLAKDTQKIYGFSKPTYPVVYMVDHPGTAFYMDDKAKNISLKFRTCIYKASDVPRKVASDNINFATPISCFEWDSSFVYDHSAQEFKSYSEIDSACR